MKSRGFIIFLVFSAILPFLASFFYLFVFAGTAAGKACYTAVKIYTLAVPVVCWCALDMKTRPAAGALKKFAADSVPGIYSGILIFLFVFPLYFFLLKPELLRYASNLAAKSAEFGIETPLKYIAFSAFLSFPHSFIEEAYWRYFVYGKSRAEIGERASAILGSAAFAAHHYVVLYNFFGTALAVSFGTAVFLAGYVWALQYRSSGSLAAPWISHIAADLCVLAIGYDLIFMK